MGSSIRVGAHQGNKVEGRILEVRVMLDETLTRQVFACKDRTGVERRIE